MDQLRIFLADLTYDTVSLSTDANPLNTGYIAAYCNKLFGDQVEITLYKYISDLENAIYSNPPDVLGMSNYCWCERIGLEFFELVTKLNPDTICVWGGPNFPADRPSQDDFLAKRSQFDVYVPLEGEVGFSNIINRLIEVGSIPSRKQELRDSIIEGCIIKNNQGQLRYGDPAPRFRNLDDIPSPYLMGLLDNFFDGRLKPRIQTSRGCPFTCTFCVDGSHLVNKVNKFSLERITSELYYIAEHVPPETVALGISDLNFGMYSRDLEICDVIADIQSKYGYPKRIMTTTGKNSKNKIIKTIKKLNGSINLSMSVQSMDHQVLDNIRRKNISVEKMLDIAPAIKQANLNTVSEVILGLPGDSYDTHVSTLRSLIQAGVDHVQAYTLMLLPGSELNTPTERNKWGYKTKFRILPRDFVELKSGKKVLEVEEVVVESSTLSFDQYLQLRSLAFILKVCTHGIVFDALFKLLRAYGVDVFDVMYGLLAKIREYSEGIGHLLTEFEDATADELWDDPEELIRHYQDDLMYKRLVHGEAGINIIQYFHAATVVRHMNELIELLVAVSGDFLRALPNYDESVENELASVRAFIKGISNSPLANGGIYDEPVIDMNYDIPSWLSTPDQVPINTFHLKSPSRCSFRYSDEQDEVIRKELLVYGDTPVGRAQVVKRVHVKHLWRQPVV